MLEKLIAALMITAKLIGGLVMTPARCVEVALRPEETQFFIQVQALGNIPWLRSLLSSGRLRVGAVAYARIPREDPSLLKKLPKDGTAAHFRLR